jgi:hypothetical protein
MTTCFIKYIIDPSKIADFEHYGKLWIDLVNEMATSRLFIASWRANNIGYASFLSVVGRLRNLSEQNSEHTKMSWSI